MTIEEKNEYLKNASVPKYLWDVCYVLEDKSTYFTPRFTSLELTEWDKTGEEVYSIWLEENKVATS